MQALAPCPDDWLVLAGDVGEAASHLELTFEALAPRFAKLLWVPGNHELWTLPTRGGLDALEGEARYLALVELARRYGVVTPEDPFPTLRAPDGVDVVVAPLFTLYDYTFAPDDVGPERAKAWAAEEGIVCTDEALLRPAPHADVTAWCDARIRESERRLDALPPGAETVLVSHFPLRRDHAVLPWVPRFVPWCGTRRTEAWHLRYRARGVVSGHLHVRATRVTDGVRFDEVSWGYPRNRADDAPLDAWLREIPLVRDHGPDRVTYHRGRAGD